MNKYKLNFECNEKFNINKDNWINKYKLNFEWNEKFN